MEFFSLYKEPVAGTATEETEAIEPFVIQCVGAATGGCQEDVSAVCGCSDGKKGVATSDVMSLVDVADEVFVSVPSKPEKFNHATTHRRS